MARADIAVAMGSGSGAALERAGTTLPKGDLARLAAARRLSKATLRSIRQNLVFVFIHNMLGVPLAAGVVFPLTGWLLSPMIARGGDEPFLATGDQQCAAATARTILSRLASFFVT